MVIWPLPPAVFTYRRQHPDVVDGAVSCINLVFHHTLLVAHRLLGPIHPQQPMKKVSQVLIDIFIPILLTSHGSTGLKTHQMTRYHHHGPFPSFEGCEACRTQPGCYRRQGRPHQGETRKVRCSRAPAMFALTHLSRHITQNPNP
jgi:hypothetical protein